MSDADEMAAARRGADFDVSAEDFDTARELTHPMALLCKNPASGQMMKQAYEAWEHLFDEPPTTHVGRDMMTFYLFTHAYCRRTTALEVIALWNGWIAELPPPAKPAAGIDAANAERARRVTHAAVRFRRWVAFEAYRRMWGLRYTAVGETMDAPSVPRFASFKQLVLEGVLPMGTRSWVAENVPNFRVWAMIMEQLQLAVVLERAALIERQDDNQLKALAHQVRAAAPPAAGGVGDGAGDLDPRMCTFDVISRLVLDVAGVGMRLHGCLIGALRYLNAKALRTLDRADALVVLRMFRQEPAQWAEADVDQLRAVALRALVTSDYERFEAIDAYIDFTIPCNDRGEKDTLARPQTY